MRPVARILLDRRVDRLGRPAVRRRKSARQEFLETWKTYGNRIARLLLAAYQAGQGRVSVTLRSRLVRQRRGAGSGTDDLIEVTVDVRVAELAKDDVLLKHYEQLGRGDLLALTERASGEQPCPDTNTLANSS